MKEIDLGIIQNARYNFLFTTSSDWVSGQWEYNAYILIFNKYLLNTYCMSGPVFSPWDVAVNNIDKRPCPVFMKLTF